MAFNFLGNRSRGQAAAIINQALVGSSACSVGVEVLAVLVSGNFLARKLVHEIGNTDELELGNDLRKMKEVFNVLGVSSCTLLGLV